MTSYDSLVEKLREELKHEALSRQLQEEVNSKLQDEYDVLLKRLAEAESHIDRLRFCSDLELNKHFLIRHQTEQHATLRQRLTAWLDPVTASHQQTGILCLFKTDKKSELCACACLCVCCHVN